MKNTQEAVPLKFGVIGCRHGHVYSQIRGLLAIPGAECAGVYDADDESVAGVQKEFPVKKLDSPERLLDDPTVNLIGTAGINSEKAGTIIRALEAGKHAISDKPLTGSAEALNAIEALATEKGLRVGMQLSERFSPASRRMKALVDEGAVGHVANVMCWRPHRLGRAGRPDWMFVDEQYGGILVDLGVHDADIMRWVTGGDFLEMTAYEQNFGNPTDTDFHDIGTFLGKLSTGATGIGRTDWFTPEPSPVHGDTRFLVTGTLGMIEVRTAGDLWSGKEERPAEVYIMTSETTPVKVNPLPPEKSLVREFIDSIFLGTKPGLTNRDVFEATRAMIMARMSSKLGRMVTRNETIAA